MARYQWYGSMDTFVLVTVFLGSYRFPQTIMWSEREAAGGSAPLSFFLSLSLSPLWFLCSAHFWDLHFSLFCFASLGRGEGLQCDKRNALFALMANQCIDLFFP